MSNKQLATIQPGGIARSQNEHNADVVALITKGDLNGLSNEQVLQVYIARCDAIGVDARTQPFDVLTFQGKKQLYPNARLAEQLISQYGLSVDKVREETTPDGIRLVEVKVYDGKRSVTASAALNVATLKGEQLANAWMKCETKATRRGVLRFCGLGAMAEAPEYDAAQTVVDFETGEIVAAQDDSEAHRKAGLKRLHAAGKEAGMNHEQVREFAQQYHDIASLTELDGGQLEALADVVKDAPNVVAHDNETADSGVWDAWQPVIDAASTIEELNEIAAGMKEAGITEKSEPMLMRHWRGQVNRVKIAAAQVNRKADEDARRAAFDAQQAG